MNIVWNSYASQYDDSILLLIFVTSILAIRGAMFYSNCLSLLTASISMLLLNRLSFLYELSVLLLISLLLNLYIRYFSLSSKIVKQV